MDNSTLSEKLLPLFPAVMAAIGAARTGNRESLAATIANSSTMIADLIVGEIEKAEGRACHYKAAVTYETLEQLPAEEIVNILRTLGKAADVAKVIQQGGG